MAVYLTFGAGRLLHLPRLYQFSPLLISKKLK